MRGRDERRRRRRRGRRTASFGEERKALKTLASFRFGEGFFEKRFPHASSFGDTIVIYGFFYWNARTNARSIRQALRVVGSIFIGDIFFFSFKNGIQRSLGCGDVRIVFG
jgi:hypothetical protein